MLSIKIGNEYLPSNIVIKAGTLNMNQGEAGTISVLGFTLINLNNNDFVFDNIIGREFNLYQDGILIYGGQLDEPSIKELKRSPIIESAITCVDWTYLTTKRYLNQAYRRQLISDMIKQMIDDKLAADGIWYDSDSIKETTGLYVAINCDYAKCQDIFDTLVDLINWQWRIGPDKKFYLNDKKSDISTTQLIEDVSNYIPDSLVITPDRSEYRNRQILRDVHAVTDELVEKATPTPDNDNTFMVRFPLNSKPKLYLTNTFPILYSSQLVDPAQIGIGGINEGLKFYWNEDSNIITKDQDTEEIQTGYILAVKYFGKYQINVISQDNTEIAERAAIEGTSGIYEDVESGADIVGLDIAEDKADALIEKYGKIAQKINLTSYTIDWNVGEIVDVILPRRKINSLTSEGNGFLVTGKSFRTNGKLILRQYELMDGAAIGGWIKYFSSFLMSGKDWSLREDVTVSVPIEVNEPIDNTGVINLKLLTALYPDNTLYPDNALYPGTIANTATYYD